MCDHITCFSTQSLSKAFHALIKSNFCKVLGSLDTTAPMFPYLLPIQTVPQLPQLFFGSCASIPVSQSIFPGCTFCMDCPDSTTWYTFYAFGFFMYPLSHKAYTDIFNHSLTQFPDPALTSLEHVLFNTVVALLVFCFFYQTIYSIKLGQIVPFVP